MGPESARTPHERRTDTHDPRRARRRALLILYQADVRRASPADLLTEIAADPEAVGLLDDHDDDCPPGPSGLDDFTRRLVEGVAADRDRLDQLIGQYARRWEVSRMPIVDRNALRLAAWELAHEDTPAAVVIDEAVENVKAASTDDSPRFVNGVLESLRRYFAGEDASA